MSKHGYHMTEIKKGVLGETSKIREELEELEDAERQGNRIMALVELSDLYGAMKAKIEAEGFTMGEVILMHEATVRAFRSGNRG